MIRGARIINGLLFSDDVTTETAVLPAAKGRNPDLNEKRNECLLDRFVYHSIKTKMYFNCAISEVAPQFFLSSFHASKLILAQRDKLSAIRRQWKNEPVEKMQKHFARKWPHLAWS